MNVCVVDNASNDGTVELVREKFPWVILLENDENAGFSKANNRAIETGSAEYVLVLNPDTQITAGALDHLLSLMDERSEIGICGCRLERLDGTEDHAAKRSFPTPLSALGHFSGLAKRRRLGRLGAYTAPGVAAGQVDAVNGAFMLMRRVALDDVGLFDEGYWMYMEDLDLCYRFHEEGWIIWYEPSVTVMHMKGGATGKYRRPRLNYAFHYGMYRFYRKHYARRRNPLVNFAVYVGIALKLGLAIARAGAGRRIPSRG